MTGIYPSNSIPSPNHPSYIHLTNHWLQLSMVANHNLIMAVFTLKVSVFLLFGLLNFSQRVVIEAVAAEDVQAIKVGVILDTDWYGKVAKTAFEIAAEDVNKETNSSRIELNFGFSGGDGKNAVMAASAAVDLLKSQVVAIIGPQTSQEAGFVVALCNASKVPMVSFSVTDPLLSTRRYPYFIRLPHSDAVQADAIAALVEYYRWREVVAVYSDNDYGIGVLPFLRTSLDNVGCEIAYRSAIPANPNRTAIRAKLSQLKGGQTRVFVIHMTFDLGTIFFSEAHAMGMMTKDYAWIITEGFSALLNVLNETSIASMRGVLGTRTYMPKSNQPLDFDRRWKPRFIAENPQEAKSAELNIYGYYAYDAVSMITRALRQFDNAEFNFSASSYPSAFNNSQLSNLTVFQQGEQLLELLGNSNFTGLSGHLQVNEGEILGATYEILNVIPKGYRQVGYWTRDGKNSWLSKQLVASNSFKKGLEAVIWPGGSPDTPRGWVLPTNTKKMRIAVPVKSGFTEFLRTEADKSGRLRVAKYKPGFVIEIFQAVCQNLSYKLPHYFVPYEHNIESDGYYDDLIKQVSLKKFDAAVGDFTILAQRSELVDFTQPYFESGLVMVVPIKEANPSNPWTFIFPFTAGMWSITGALFVFTGIVVWLLEHKINETFRGTPKYQVTTFLWFSFSTLFFSQREKVVSSLARGVIIIWLFVVLILQSSYTANLTAILTTQQMQPTVLDVESLKSSGASVGYQAGSFVDSYLEDHLMIDRTKLKALSTPQEYKDALSNGSVAAIFDEIPYICVFLSENKGFTIVGPTYRTGGLGFVFPKRSPFVSDMSTSVLQISEGNETRTIRANYFNNTDCQNAGPQENSNRLSMESFWGLFLITGSASGLCLLIYLCHLVYHYIRHRLPHEEQQFPSTRHLISSRLRSFAIFMDEKKLTNQSEEINRASDQNLPESPNFDATISPPPVTESPVIETTGGTDENEEDEDDAGTINSGSSSSRSSSFSLGDEH